MVAILHGDVRFQTSASVSMLHGSNFFGPSYYAAASSAKRKYQTRCAYCMQDTMVMIHACCETLHNMRARSVGIVTALYCASSHIQNESTRKHLRTLTLEPV
eukprot:6302086-Amphidinium_carterae.2